MIQDPHLIAPLYNDININHLLFFPDGQPVFVVPLEDAYLFDEGTLLLSCEFRGRPQPKITWYRGGQVINRRANHIQCWREQGRVACLRIVCISIEEGGDFCCVAENSKGRAETRCRVDVAGKFIRSLMNVRPLPKNVNTTKERY